MKKFLIFPLLLFILLFTADCSLFRGLKLEPKPSDREVILEKKIQELEEEIRRLKEGSGLQIKEINQNIEDVKKLIELLKIKHGELPGVNFPIFVPENVVFCGEEVPLNKFNIRERLEQALINEMNRSSMALVFLRSGSWFPLIEQKIKEKNLPEDLKYIAAIESDLNPEAYSYAGAAGLWQFIKDTGRRYLKINSYIDERFDPEKSTEAARKHLGELYSELGDWPSALVGYNMHKDRYKKEKAKERASDFYEVRDIPSEALQYPFRAIAVKLIMEHPDKYGFPTLEELNKIKYKPYPIEAAMIDVGSRSERIVDIAKRLGMSYQEFRVLNPHILIKKNSYGEVVRDYLPRGKYRVYVLKK